MKKIIHGLLATVLTVSSAFGAVSNKTFMADRGSHSNNAVMGMSVRSQKAHGSFGANVSVSGFYRESHNHTDLAKYFGGGTTDATRLGTIALGNDDIIFMVAGDSGTVTLKPHRHEYGAHVSWTQCLGKLVKGLSLKVDLPIVHVQTSMGATYSTTAIGTYFEGGTHANNSLLAKQKHSSTENTETGVADVAVSIAYNLAHEADYSVDASLNVTVPTGNKPAAVWAFEPLYGSKHFSLGAGLNAMFNLWRAEDGKSALDFNAGVNYAYGFKAKEVRTLGVYDRSAAAVLDHTCYRQLGAGGDPTAACNLTSLEVDVTPQSSIDGLAGFTYRSGQFSVDVAYNLHWAQEEKVASRDNWSTTSDNYGIAEVGDDAGAVAATGGVTIDRLSTTSTTNDYLVTSTATTPSKVTHKVGGGIGYNFDTKTPIRVGVGGEGEFNSNNDSINSWAVWAKLGFCF